MCGCNRKVPKFKYTSPTGETFTYATEAAAKLAVKRGGGSWKKIG